MLHVLQSLSDGTTTVAEVPAPAAGGASLVVETRATVVSAGTERMLVEFGRAGLLEKARQQPDKVRQVLDKVRTDGLGPTLDAVRAKLEAPIPLGYCQAGIVVDAGPRVSGFAPGDRVVTNGPHAEYVRVAQTLAARIPDGVSFDHAAFTPLAAIGLQGVRLARPTLGETAVVYGLGLIGQLTVQLARAHGCRVIGIDRDEKRLALARGFGAETVAAGDDADVAGAVLDLTGGVGADVVLLTLASTSDDPVRAAAAMARKRGRLVLIGVTGLHLRREDFYRKELSFQVSCSYGPGRYDPVHEEQGVDYPLPFVRWTEGRNFEAVLQLMADGRLTPAPLITHRYPIAEAPRAYQLIASAEPSLGVVLEYPAKNGARPARTVELAPRAASAAAGGAPGRAVVGAIGSGNFASRVLLPAFAKAGATLEVVASSGGVSAAVVGRRHGFRRATTETDAVIGDPAVDTLAITTRHDTHAALAARGLAAGKHVFVEKPLAISAEPLEQVRAAARGARGILCVGYNRRFAPLVRRMKEATRGRQAPLVIDILVNAGAIPREHWTQDREAGGGRIVGEATHFIDLARFLAGAPIAGVQVVAARSGGTVADDIASMQLAFADGSIASIRYLANGNRAFPKERIELVWEGKNLQLDNFRRLRGWGVAGTRPFEVRGQDKGHAALAAAFVDAVRSGGPPPIPAGEILEVTEWSIRAAALAAAGGGASP